MQNTNYSYVVDFKTTDHDSVVISFFSLIFLIEQILQYTRVSLRQRCKSELAL